MSTSEQPELKLLEPVLQGITLATPVLCLLQLPAVSAPVMSEARASSSVLGDQRLTHMQSTMLRLIAHKKMLLWDAVLAISRSSRA